MQIESGIINIKDQKYPQQLHQIYKPPKSLYYKGDLDLLNKTCISIIGTRKFSQYGEEVTKNIIQELSVLDICVVSGLALGIDTISHKAALNNKIPTIAVLGSGIENIYPIQNKELSERISNNGLILCEYPEKTPPLKHHFPERNRIVSGLSIASLVIEAPIRSGSLITAKLALEQGKEVFVVPGDVHRENSEGCIHLIQNGGAYPVKSGQDIIEVLHRQPHLFLDEKSTNQNSPNSAKVKEKKKLPINLKLSSTEKKVIESISHKRPITITQLNSKTKLNMIKLLETLSFLEVKGLINEKNEKYFRII